MTLYPKDRAITKLVADISTSHAFSMKDFTKPSKIFEFLLENVWNECRNEAGRGCIN
jgi:hypothetical protein